MPGYWHKMALCSHLVYSICNCKLDAIMKLSLAKSTKQWISKGLTNSVGTQGPGALFSARKQGLDLVLGHRVGARIRALALEKLRGVFTLVPGECLTQGTVAVHQV